MKKNDHKSNDYICDPSFIMVSLGRSGTSLFKNIIDSHTELFLSDECHWIRGLQQPGKTFHQFVEVDDLSVTDIPLSSKWWEGVRVLNRSLFSKIKKQYWGLQFIGHYNIPSLSFLYKTYPNIPTVILTRDPRDLLHSYYRTGIGVPNFTEDLCSIRDIVEKHTPNYHIIKYEDLCNNPIESLKKLCLFLNVDYQSNMLRALSKKVSHAQNIALNHNSTITNECSQKWQDSLSVYQVFSLEDSCSGIEKLDYPIIQGEGELISNKELSVEFIEANSNYNLSFNQQNNEKRSISYIINFKVAAVLKVTCSLEHSLRLKYKENIYLGKYNSTLKAFLFDLRNNGQKKYINYSPHKNGKQVKSCLEVLDSNPKVNFFIYSCSTLSIKIIKRYSLYNNKSFLGVLDCSPKSEQLICNGRLIPLYNAYLYQTLNTDIILVTNPAHLSAAKNIFNNEKNTVLVI